MAMDRIVIIGNSGSGKSYLAAQLGARLAVPVTHLDQLFWEPGGFTVKRPQARVLRDIERVKQNPRWIAEGVFGELARRFLEDAEALIWLDMDWAICHSNLLQRGSESDRQPDPQAAEASFQRLLVWASQYWAREDLRSHRGHQAIFDTFPRAKRALRSRAEVDLLIDDPSSLE
jgi:adenylate kinase family enzyme